METKNILTADILDIIFDQRNKNYGAYQLRREYDKRMIISFSSMMLLVVIMALFSFIKPPIPKAVILPQTILDPTLVKPPVKENKQLTRPSVNQKLRSSIAIHPPIIVKNDVQVKPNINLNNIDVIDAPNGTDFPIGPAALMANDSSHIQTTIPVKPEPAKPAAPINDPEVMPQFPGGTAALIKFLQHNLKSPEDMEEDAIKDVRIRFVVDYNGNLSAFDIAKSGGNLYDQEVIRVLKKMPKWNPGKSHDQNVSVYFTLPVKFTSTP